MSVQTQPRLTPHEYLAFERASEEHHKFLDGETFAMMGASRPHNLINLNIAASLHVPGLG